MVLNAAMHQATLASQKVQKMWKDFFFPLYTIRRKR